MPPDAHAPNADLNNYMRSLLWPVSSDHSTYAILHAAHYIAMCLLPLLPCCPLPVLPPCSLLVT